MLCHDVHEWMSLSLDRRLSPEQQRAMEAHLAGCPACAREWELWQEVAHLFAKAPLAQPPEGFTARVLSRLEARPQRGALLGSLLVTAVGVILIGALALAPWAQVCQVALLVVQAPGLLGVVAGAMADLIHPLAIVADVARVLLRTVATPPSALAALGYTMVLLAALAGWLRLVVLAPARSRSGTESVIDR